MRLLLTLSTMVFLALAVSTSVTRSAPIDGVYAKKVEIPAEGLKITKRFRGGERASAQVAGDHKDAVTVHILIHDAQGALVAEDKGKAHPVADMAAVIWYPPRDGEYKVTIRTSAGRAVKYYVAIR